MIADSDEVNWDEGESFALGNVHFSEAPKTWVVDIPSDYDRVGVGCYGLGVEEQIYKYCGWLGYLVVNGEYVYEFMDWDSTAGTTIHDYLIGEDLIIDNFDEYPRLLGYYRFDRARRQSDHLLSLHRRGWIHRDLASNR